MLTIIVIILLLALLLQGRFPDRAFLIEILYVVLIVFLILTLLNFIPLAHAQVEVTTTTAPPPDDFDQLIDKVQEVAQLIVLAVIAAAGLALRSWLASHGWLAKKQTEIIDQTTFDHASLLALSLLESKLRKASGGADPEWSKVDLANPFLLESAAWMKEHWPDAVGKMTIPEIATSLFARIPTGEMTAKAFEFAEVKASKV